MHTRRVVLVVVGVLAASTLLFGTGAFSAASMDRGVHVSVADSPHDAFVSLWDVGDERPAGAERTAEPVVDGSGTVPVLLVVDHFDRSIALEVSSPPDSPVSVHGSGTTLNPAAPKTIDAVVDCQGHHGATEVPLSVSVHTIGGGVSARIHTSASIDCGTPEQDSPADAADVSG